MSEPDSPIKRKFDSRMYETLSNTYQIPKRWAHVLFVLSGCVILPLAVIGFFSILFVIYAVYLAPPP